MLCNSCSTITTLKIKVQYLSSMSGTCIWYLPCDMFLYLLPYAKTWKKQGCTTFSHKWTSTPGKNITSSAKNPLELLMSKAVKSLETFRKNCSYNHKRFPKTSQLLALLRAGHIHPCLSLYLKKSKQKPLKEHLPAGTFPVTTANIQSSNTHFVTLSLVQNQG